MVDIPDRLSVVTYDLPERGITIAVPGRIVAI